MLRGEALLGSPASLGGGGAGFRSPWPGLQGPAVPTVQSDLLGPGISEAAVWDWPPGVTVFSVFRGLGCAWHVWLRVTWCIEDTLDAISLLLGDLGFGFC